MDIEMSEIIWVALAAFIAGLARRYLGFGFALLSVPLLSLRFEFTDAVYLTVLIGFAMSVYMAVIYRHDLQIKNAIGLKLYSLVGVAAGLGLANLVQRELLAAIGLVVVLIFTTVKALDVWEDKLNGVFRNRFIAGGFSGALSYWVGVGGPPVVMYYNSFEASAEHERGALAGYFLILTSWTAASYTVSEGVSLDILPKFIVGVVAVVAASFAAKPLLKIRSKHFSKIIELAVIGTVLISLVNLISSSF